MFGTRPLTPNSAGITGPMNINAVIAHLVEMTPPQRKQFAQMHMDDPMMLSAAKFVDNQIAKQAQSIAAQATGAAPPPVNQQVVAQMLPQPPAPQAAPQPQAAQQPQGQPMPEDSGIAQLPAPNMPGKYAAGGIVAFDGGGPVNGVYVPDSGVPPNVFIMGNMWKDPETGKTGYLPGYGPGVGRTGYEGMTLGDLAKKAKEKLEDLLVSGTYNKQKLAEKRQAEAVAGTPALLNKDAPAYTGPSVAAPATGAGAGQGKRGSTDVPPEVAAPKEKKGVDQLRVPNVAPAPAVAPTIQASLAPATSGLDYNAAFSSALKAEGNPRDNLPPEIAEIGDLAKAQRTKAMALADKQSEGLNALVSARQARQDAREQSIAQQEAINPWMAMITGGLAIAQSKGKGLSGLAEGSQAGINQYMTEAKYTNAQRQKLEDARDALQELKYNGETMTNKDRLAAENSLTQGLMAVKDATVKHIAHKEELNLKTAGHKFDAMVQRDIETQREAHQTQLEGQRQQFESGIHASDNAQRLAIARMEIGAANARANQLPGEARTLMALGGNDLKKGMEMQAAISAGKFNPLTAYTSHYLPGFAGKETLTPPMTYPQFLATLGMPAVRP